MTDLLVSALGAILAVTVVAHLLSALLAAWRYRQRSVAPADDTELPYISLVRPVCGLDTFDAETLGSSFAQEYPRYEVIFSAPSDRDPAVPLAREMDTLHLPIDGDPTATGMGNPHCTFFVDDVDAIDLAGFGPGIEHHALYPERTNVQIAQIIGPHHIRMRVWERGVGITLASGSSSCATAVAAARRGLTGRAVRIDLDGGTLHIDWREDGVWMTGPSAHVFSGVLTPSFLESLT
mgnify:CR=1 FL=1